MFPRTEWKETFRGYDVSEIKLERRPLVSLGDITYDGETYDASQFYIVESADADDRPWVRPRVRRSAWSAAT